MSAKTDQSTEPAAPLENGVRALLNAVVDAVIVVDENESITAVNAAAEALLGARNDAVVGATLASAMPALVAHLPIGALCSRGSDGVFVETGVGAAIPIHVVAEELGGASRLRYVVVARDCRRIEGALERLVRGQRLVAVDAAMSALTHDVRNLLQHMQSCLTLIGLRGNDEVRALAEDMQQAQDRLQRLFEHARGLAAPIRLERRLADVRKIIERAWRALRLLWSRKAITLTIDADRCADSRAHVDLRLLGQALRGVLERVIEAAPENGTVVCTLSGGGGEHLEIAFQRTGVEAATQLDGESFDLGRANDGSGMEKDFGMAQRLIKEHDGELRLDEHSRGGSRLVIVLPQQSLAS